MMRLLSAIILGVSLVIVALLMGPPRYEEFPVDDTENQFLHGVFDNRTGEVCYQIVYREGRTPEGQSEDFIRCGSRP